MADTMLAVMVIAPGRTQVCHVPRPEPGPYDALTRTLACSFCRGTDTHLIEGTLPFGPRPPFILGHEGVGEVIAVGNRCRKFRVGDRVLRAGAAYPPGTPGAPDVAWGGFAEFGLLTDADAMHADGVAVAPTAFSAPMQQHVPDGLDPVEATVLITLKETLSSLRRGRLQPGQDVLIYGTGPVGLGFAACARALGARRIVAAGRHPGRLERMQRFGADCGVAITDGALADRVRAVTGRRGVDLAIDAVGDRSRISDLLACLAPGGTVGVYGVPTGTMADYTRFEFQTAGAPAWWSVAMLNPDEPSAHEEVCQLVAAGKLDLAPFVTHVFPVARLDEARAALAGPDAIKVVLTFP